jgi:hypothetical protein
MLVDGNSYLICINEKGGLKTCVFGLNFLLRKSFNRPKLMKATKNDGPRSTVHHESKR